MTILHLTAGAVLGGVTRYICDLSTAMRQAGGHRVMAAGSRGPWQSLMSDAGIEWIELPLDGGPWALWKSSGAIARLIRQRGIDVVHCHFRRPVLAARLACRRGGLRVPIVYTLHLSPLPLRGPWGWLSDFGDWVIAPSNDARQWIEATGRVPTDRLFYIPHGVRPEDWPLADQDARAAARQALGIEAGRPVACFVGRFEGVKNEDWIIDLAEECARRPGVNPLWLVCGDGPRLDHLKARIARAGLASTVRLLGYINPLQVYHASDLLLLPSRIEGFGYVAAEAACSGLAVLRTRTAGWQETVRDGLTGRVVPVDRKQFIDATIEMLSDLKTLRSMGEAGAAMVRKHLTLQQQVDGTLKVYRRAATSS